MIAVFATARMTALSPGQSPPPVSIASFFAIGSPQKVFSARFILSLMRCAEFIFLIFRIAATARPQRADTLTRGEQRRARVSRRESPLLRKFEA